MNEELLELLAKARRALQAGRTKEEVDSAIASHPLVQSIGWSEAGLEAPTTYKELFTIVNEQILNPMTEEEESLARTARTGAGEDFLTAFLHGLTFGGSDELRGVGAALIPGGRGYAEARDRQRQRIEDLRRVDPGAMVMGELAGGLIVPGMGGMRVARATRSLGLPRIVAGAAGGATAGGLGGLLYGAGEGETLGERARGAALGGTGGALLGGLLGTGTAALSGPAGRATRAVARLAPEETRIGQWGRYAGELPGARTSRLWREQRSERVAERLRRTTGERRTRLQLETQLDEEAERVRRSFYRRIEQANREITDADILQFVRQKEVKKYFPREVAAGRRAPSYQEVQGGLQRMNRQLYMEMGSKAPRSDIIDDLQRWSGELDELLGSRIQGHRAASRAYHRRVGAPRRAVAKGYSIYDKPVDQIQAFMADLPNERARDAFRIGAMTRWIEGLEVYRGTGIQGALRKLSTAGKDRIARINALFKTQAEADEFWRLVNSELRGEAWERAIRKKWPWIAAAAMMMLRFGPGAYAIRGVIQ